MSVAPRHQVARHQVDERGRTGRSASCGPAAASGWYCTENAGTSRQRSPSTTLSLRSTWLTSTRPNACRDRAVERRVDGEPVVVAGDLDPAGRAVLHRLVDAAVAEPQLVGAEAERPAEHLVAEADAEHRLDPEHAAAAPRPARRRSPGRPGRWRRTPRPGSTASRSAADAVAGSTCTSHPRCREIARRRRLDAEVERGDGEALVPHRFDDVRLGRGDLAGEIGAGHPRAGEHPLQQRLGVGLGAADTDPHRAALAQVAGQRAGVDAADADDAVGVELVVEAAARPPVARHPGRVAHDVAGHPDPPRLRVLVVDPVLPMCGAVCTTTWRWYDGSVSVSW